MRAVSEAAGRKPATDIPVDRGFLRLREGLMHYRCAGAGPRTMWLMHASPASSASLQGLVLALGRECRAIAPDTPGYGDSAGLAVEQPGLAEYADAQLRMMDEAGVNCAVLYGHHTGAHIAIEMAIRAPERVSGLVLEGLLWLDDAERDEYLRAYAPPMPPDAWGTQVFQALQWLRDQAWFFPHFRKDAAHNLGIGALPADVLHVLLIDLLKSGPRYGDAYRAVFLHQLAMRLPLVQAPVVLLEIAGDPTAGAMDRAADCLARVERVEFEDGWSADAMARKARAIMAVDARR